MIENSLTDEQITALAEAFDIDLDEPPLPIIAESLLSFDAIF